MAAALSSSKAIHEERFDKLPRAFPTTLANPAASPYAASNSSRLTTRTGQLCRRCTSLRAKCTEGTTPAAIVRYIAPCEAKRTACLLPPFSTTIGNTTSAEKGISSATCTLEASGQLLFNASMYLACCFALGLRQSGLQRSYAASAAAAISQDSTSDATWAGSNSTPAAAVKACAAAMCYKSSSDRRSENEFSVDRRGACHLSQIPALCWLAGIRAAVTNAKRYSVESFRSRAVAHKPRR